MFNLSVHNYYVVTLVLEDASPKAGTDPVPET